MRWELCNVGTRSASCDGAGVAARAEASPLAIAQDVKGHVKELELSWFDATPPNPHPCRRPYPHPLACDPGAPSLTHTLTLTRFDVALPPSLAGIKIVLVPINGDADLYVSFSTPQPERNAPPTLTLTLTLTPTLTPTLTLTLPPNPNPNPDPNPHLQPLVVEEDL